MAPGEDPYRKQSNTLLGPAKNCLPATACWRAKLWSGQIMNDTEALVQSIGLHAVEALKENLQKLTATFDPVEKECTIFVTLADESESNYLEAVSELTNLQILFQAEAQLVFSFDPDPIEHASSTSERSFMYV